MNIWTFEAQVSGGQLYFQEPLADLEGQQVRVTIVAGNSSSTARPSVNDDLIEPPDWLPVEKNVYVKMPFRGETILNPVIIDGGPLHPTIILPQDLPE